MKGGLDDTPEQRRLAGLLAARAAWVGRPVPAPGGQAPESEAGADEDGRAVVLVLIRRFDVAGFVTGARRFAAGLSATQVRAWSSAWTRTRFLFGNPANLAPRMPARLVTESAGAGWLGPFPDGRVPGPARLLKPVRGGLPQLAARVPAAAPGAASEDSASHSGTSRGPVRDLHLAVRDLSLPEYLVHLHHTVAESVLQGELLPHESLRLIHRPDLDTELTHSGHGYARVAFAPGGKSLRLYAWLAPAPSGAAHREEHDR